MAERIWVGTASWSDHTIYPQGMRAADQIAHYAQFLPMVELNASFYRMFPVKQYAAWAARTPDDFRFSVKAYRALSLHLNDEPPTGAHFEEHLRAVAPLVAAERFLGFVVQFPHWIRPSDKHYLYLERLRAGFGEAPVAVEFRHRSWVEAGARDETIGRLRDARLAMVMLDEPRADATGLFPSLGDVTEPSLGYFRFQGRDAEGKIADRERHGLRERHDYTDDEIGSLAERIEKVSERLSGPAVVVFHNNYTSLAVSASQRMIDQLTEHGLPTALLAIRRRLGELEASVEAPESPG